MSSPLDENATNSIASTLASLGLNDDLTTSHDKISHNTTAQHYLQPTQKVPPTRPRAISLGMMDSPLSLPQPSSQTQYHTGFSPFDLSYRSSSEYQPLRSTNSHLIDENIQTMPLLYQPRIFSQMNSHEEDIQSEMESMATPSRLSSPNNIESSTSQIPSRALWLGNVSPSLSVPDLHKMFSRYGHVESARILSDKECAFVNFETVESAIAAKEDLVKRLGSKVGGTVVKVGFGKADVSLAMALTQDAGPNAQGPTRSLWVGNIPSNINPAVLRSIFQVFGTIESIRILSHKNCGFINFERQEDAVRARKHMQNKEILGPGTGTVRIGFAKAPSNNPDEIIEDPTDTPNTTQWATVILMASMMMNAHKNQDINFSTPNSSSLPSPTSSSSSNLQTNARLAAERGLIMQQLGYEPTSDEVKRNPIHYFPTIPTVPEFNADRKLSPLRLREIKKGLDNGQVIQNIESIAQECIEEIVELCSDYIGNTVVQKFFDYCSDNTKLAMLKRIAPHLASIGIHKNGTWAAQKIIDSVNVDEQIELVSKNIAPYVPSLLLDQFGNYVVQCCLRKGPKYNQYIFDAIVDKSWEIGQGRFGSRAVRSILENPIVTKEQRIYVAAAIMQNALLLSTNANGTILLNWLLDTSGLLGNYHALHGNTNS
ncbi:MAG: hypothetical protein EXX96DRAFT_475904 [Benjaminiella poitrasii]|nr:MAG: hypothetical protein EXX96DRAFT_475904 [Benjaminiella poitrasii]